MKTKFILFLVFFIWAYTAAIALYFPISSNISFWYDPARDLLSAWANLHKLTLIGPPSGIPGFFYGPYWIWWLSIGLLISKNPSTVTIFTMTLPYLFGFAGVLLLFSKLFGKTISLLLWLLFFMAFLGYMTQLWNPYLSPILYLSAIYLLVFYFKKPVTLFKLFPIFLTGIITGFALNIHISFSVGFTLGCIAYFFFSSFFFTGKNFSKIKQFFLFFLSFCIGIVLTFIPFLLFELRHGFHQTRIAMNAFFHGGDVVLQHGFSKLEILQQFLLRFSQLIHIPFPFSIGILSIGMLLYIFFSWKNKTTYTQIEKNLLLLIVCITCSVLAVYLLAKNPIWDYHFDGFEVLWLLLIGIVAAKTKIIRYLLLVWVVFVGIVFSRDLYISSQINPLTRGSLFTKEYIVHTIQKDATSVQYTVYAYSPSIYTYEYAYLFRWVAQKEFSYDPGRIERKGDVYLILSLAQKTYLDDFTHFHTPENLYTTAKIWHIPDGTIILKRIPNK